MITVLFPPSAVFEPDTVFRHKDVISFGCDKGLEFEEPPPEGSTFHTLKCSKGEWQGVSPVCNGEYPHAASSDQLRLLITMRSVAP